ncbi:SH3 domain-containing protein [Candidatus Liberibacter sp.]|uniref:SH3 domain-containing protein n=1 Tax=Candidatus Liberibacter sp. TaxID=34022 RepID=UPI0015F49A72|nr:SH3 domain-containing protein [Candidatus Liberibacter sp.]MBA5724439.1 hypothetical protein [Candidatus Liberibacter sp.]
MPKISQNLFFSTLAILFLAKSHVFSQDTQGSSRLPEPHFVTIKYNRTNVRIGPSKIHAISYVYLKEGFPVEVIQEYENWRHIRDFDGTNGWVNKRLLSSKRSAIVSPWENESNEQTYVNLYQKPDKRSTVVAKIEPNVLLTIHKCSGEWCFGKNSGISGWIMQNKIWGVYPNEEFK